MAAAKTINVHGVVTVETNVVTTAAYVDLGYPEPGELLSFEETMVNEPVYTSASGGVPADYVYNGSYAVLPITLIAWDDEQLTGLRKRSGATNEGEPGTIGMLWVQDVTTTKGAFGIKLTPASKSVHTPQYVFGRCIITEPIRTFDMGNKPTILAFAVTAIPDDSGDLYTMVTS